MSATAAKAFAFVVWPFLAPVLLAFMALAFFFVWFAIPFLNLRKKVDGGFEVVDDEDSGNAQ